MTRAPAVVAAAILIAVAALAAAWPNPTIAGTPVAAGKANPTATARDGAVAGATTAGLALTSANATDPDGTVDRMTEVATGPLLANLRAERAHFVEQIRQSGTEVTSQVLSAAASSVDANAGRATVLVLVKTTSTRERQTRQQRLILDMSRTPRGWKAAAVSAAPAG